MLPDAYASAVADIGWRWGHSAQSLGTYRKRLLAAGLITSVGRGRVAFADAAVRVYVQIQAAADGFIELPPTASTP